MVWRVVLYTTIKILICKSFVLTQVKHTIGMDYPNLPYLIDGDVKMSESLAMLKYIARKGKWAINCINNPRFII